MTNAELFKILSKQWASVEDIKKIASCGRDKATEIREVIISNIKDDGFNLPVSKTKIVPMSKVIDYFNLDIDFISKMAQNEILIGI